MKMVPSSAIIEPTDSSMPPVMIDAIANRPNNPTWLAVFERLAGSRNRGLMSATAVPTSDDEDQEAEILLVQLLPL